MRLIPGIPKGAASLHRKQMNIHRVDQIMEARKRVIERGQTPAALVDEVTAKHLGITVEMVQEAQRIHAEEFA